MFRLAHLSDVHLGPLPEIGYRELASKRITGYVNWQRNRRVNLHDSVIERIVTDIAAQAPDHIAVTGDLVNLALDAEIELARQWLDSLGPAQDVSVVPGNHDAYVPGALDKACRAWANWMCGDGANAPVGRDSFPYLRIRGDVALIGVSTAKATAPFMAHGYFREDQAERLTGLLDETGRQELFRVVMIHHPPMRGLAAPHKRLFGISRFQSVMRHLGAELILHGHTHLPTLCWADGATGRIPVVGVAAAGQGVGGDKPPAQYNLIEIERAGRRWNARLTRRGITGAATALQDISHDVLHEGLRIKVPA